MALIHSLSRTLRRVVLIAALSGVAALSACKRREAAEAPAPAAPPAAEAPVATGPAGPLTYENTTEHAHVRLTLQPAVAAQPDLQTQLYGEGVRDLRTFSEGAQADRTEFSGAAGMGPYEKLTAWRVPHQTGKLMSLLRVTYESAGGVHPNMDFGYALWDKATRRRMEATALLRPGADTSALDRALCDALRAARRARLTEMAGPEAGAMETTCPGWSDSIVTLAPSTTPGKAGGLIFVLMPGPHAEGAYALVVPLSAFQAQLAPAYADEFAGAPVKTGEVSDDIDLNVS